MQQKLACNKNTVWAQCSCRTRGSDAHVDSLLPVGCGSNTSSTRDIFACEVQGPIDRSKCTSERERTS